MELNRRTMLKIFALCVCVILVYLAFQNLNLVFAFLNWVLGVLTPFIVAGFLTFFLNVPLKAIERHLFQPKPGKPVSELKQKARRPIAIILSIGLFVVVIAAFLTIIIPEIGKSLMTIADSIPGLINQLQNFFNDLSENNDMVKDVINNINVDWRTLSTTVMGFLQNNATNFVSTAMQFVSTIVSTAISVFLGIVISIYTLMRKEKLSTELKKIIYSIMPMKAADFVVEVGQMTNKSFYNSITGQMTECVIIGSLTALGMTILGLPYAALVGVLIAILSWIPMFGVGIGIVVGALLLLTSDPMQAVWFVIFMVCLQQIEGNLIFPRVVGSNMGLPPLIMVSSITLFANFFGIVGLLVCGPVTSVLYVLIRRFVANKIEEKEIPSEKYETAPDFSSRSNNKSKSGKNSDHTKKKKSFFSKLKK